MSLHAGHLLGLQMIKEALSGDIDPPESVPVREGSDHGSRLISENFDSLATRDDMIPEDTSKTGAEANFSSGNGYVEARDEKDGAPHRKERDRNRNEVTPTTAWRSHESFNSASSDAATIIESGS